VIVAQECVGAEPQERNDRSGYTQNKTQATKWMRALEIFQVDALCEFFGCELSSGHVESSLPQ
jgi:hypothetical protein